MLDIIGSMVIYKNPQEQLQQAISSFSNTELNIRLLLVDNSPDDRARALCTDSRITYIFNGKNLGFGAAHNIALRQAMNQSAFHAILNPDIYFAPGVLETLYEFASGRPDVGLIMPKILNPNGSIQYLCKRLPAPTDLILRRFLPSALKPLVEKRLARYELRDQDYSRIMSVPALSGCFMLISDAALSEVGLFDERYFMYLEDVDLCRRIHQAFKTIYFPGATVYHRNGKGSYRELRLLVHHLASAFLYFQKWGWYFDPDREQINARATSATATLQRTVAER